MSCQTSTNNEGVQVEFQTPSCAVEFVTPSACVEFDLEQFFFLLVDSDAAYLTDSNGDYLAVFG